MPELRLFGVLAVVIDTPRTDEIKLACGEMTAQELRTAKAVLGWFIRTRVSGLEREVAALKEVAQARAQSVRDLQLDNAELRERADMNYDHCKRAEAEVAELRDELEAAADALHLAYFFDAEKKARAALAKT